MQELSRILLTFIIPDNFSSFWWQSTCSERNDNYVAKAREQVLNVTPFQNRRKRNSPILICRWAGSFLVSVSNEACKLSYTDSKTFAMVLCILYACSSFGFKAYLWFWKGQNCSLSYRNWSVFLTKLKISTSCSIQEHIGDSAISTYKHNRTDETNWNQFTIATEYMTTSSVWLGSLGNEHIKHLKEAVAWCQRKRDLWN